MRLVATPRNFEMRKPLLFFFLAWSGKRTCLTVPSTTKEESERCNNVSGGTRTRLLDERGGKNFSLFFFSFFIFSFFISIFFSFVCVPEETDRYPRPLCFYLFALRTKRSGGDKYRISFGTIIIFKPETDKFEEGNKYCKSV